MKFLIVVETYENQDAAQMLTLKCKRYRDYRDRIGVRESRAMIY